MFWGLNVRLVEVLGEQLVEGTFGLYIYMYCPTIIRFFNKKSLPKRQHLLYIYIYIYIYIHIQIYKWMS